MLDGNVIEGSVSRKSVGLKQRLEVHQVVDDDEEVGRVRRKVPRASCADNRVV